jgi:hypothetical protein
MPGAGAVHHIKTGKSRNDRKNEKIENRKMTKAKTKNRKIKIEKEFRSIRARVRKGGRLDWLLVDPCVVLLTTIQIPLIMLLCISLYPSSILKLPLGC